MKKLSVAAIMILAVAAANAQAQLAPRVTMVEVLADGNSFEAGRLAAGTSEIPAGFRSWQIVATMTPGAKFVGAEVDLFLTEGQLHYNAILGGNLGTNIPPTLELDANGEPVVPNVILDPGFDVKTGKTAPAGALYNVPGFETLPFTTHFSSVGIDGLGHRGGSEPAFSPDPIRPGGQNTRFTLDEIIASYVHLDGLTSQSGTQVIGMITMSDDAVGTILVQVTDQDTVALTDGKDPPTVIRPANPTIFEGTITDGAVEGGEVPEPSTALLAIMGLIGMIAGFARRRRRQA
ncbi:MAG: PEP-CTERM sorting domain-containing protein [Planctomycetes bacterium]|nr:PEP-CTERM sorting domain-containing protein [Planctomycetota bacterium]